VSDAAHTDLGRGELTKTERYARKLGEEGGKKRQSSE